MKCSECPFNGPKVPGEGTTTVGEKLIAVKEDRKYDIVVVGMAPAEEEVRQGRPFVGVSGQILRKTLYQMGVKEYYVTNVFLCPITDETLIPLAKECEGDRLVNEILSKSPKLTIALGDLPLHALAETEYKIKEVEGRVIPSKVGPLLPVTHPAYFWRHPDEIFDFLECLRCGLKFLEGNYEQAVEPTYEVVTYENMGKVKEEIDKHEDLGVDLETTGFNAYGWEPNEILEMGLAVDHKHAYIVPKEVIFEFKELLEKKKGVYWNAQFDGAFLKQIGISANADFDGMLAHYTIDERGHSHGLKRVGMRYLGCDNWEKDLDKYIPKRQKKTVSYAVIPTDVRYGYLARDVTRTLQLKKVLMPDINKKVFNTLLMPACRMFIEIQHKGIRIDPVKLMGMDKILQEELDELDKKLFEMVGYWVNPRSYPQVRDLVYGKLGVPVDPFYGNSTGRAALEPYSDNPIIANILDQRVVSHTLGSYVENFARFVDHNFRIHPEINLFKTVTGRLSSDDPSIMNIKKDSRLREIFLPNVGHVLGYGDIKGNELRWYCVVSGDPELSEILRREPTPDNPRANDPHYWVAVAAYGKERADELRGPAKAVVFGRIYKRGRRSIEYQVGSDVIDAVMEAVDSIAPHIDKYYKRILKEVREKGYLESYFGRRRRFSLITPDTKHKVEREAINFPVSSPASDLMLLCMLHLFENRDRWGIWPFWPIHDSITMDLPDKSLLPVIKKELEEYSFEVVKGVMPFVWEMDWGYSWAMDKE